MAAGDQGRGGGESSVAAPTGLYASGNEALKKVQEAYDYWSGKLNGITLQMAFALTGATWAIFSNVNGMLADIWAKWSIVLILLAMVLNVIAALILSEKTNERLAYAESNLERWDTSALWRVAQLALRGGINSGVPSAKFATQK